MNDKKIIGDTFLNEVSLNPEKITKKDIYIKDAYKAFGVTKALNGCSFSAKFGEIHAIVGPNGCGKSTLAKVLSGVLPLDKGKVSIFGHTPTSPVMARKLGIATVFQEVMVADEASVVDNLFIGTDDFWYKAMTQGEKVKKAEALMEELVGEYVNPHTLASTLSLPVKAWITIGRAFLREDTKVLILDESSAALDFDSTERLFTKMRQLRDKGVAVFIVTHRIAELVRISDKATVMRDGIDVGVLEKKEITEKNLLKLMTGKSDTGDKIKNIASKSQSDNVILKTHDLQVWKESEPINLDLQQGQILGITGLDGHGQDDFVKILAGVQVGYGGYVEVKANNQYEKYKTLIEAKKKGIFFVSGDRKKEGILPNLSIYENMVMPLYRTTSKGGFLGFINWLELNGIFSWEVERLNIKTGLSTNLIGSLSGGNQQKVMIARAFAQHPKILILNDPARGIDINTKTDLYVHLRNYVNDGNTVVFLSSELEEFIGLCSKVLVFRHAGIFDIFENEKVEPGALLEGMFGQSNGLGAKIPNTRKVINLDNDKIKGNFEHKKEKIDINKIKIIDFDKEKYKEKKSEEKNQATNKIKIKVFN